MDTKMWDLSCLTQRVEKTQVSSPFSFLKKEQRQNSTWWLNKHMLRNYCCLISLHDLMRKKQSLRESLSSNLCCEEKPMKHKSGFKDANQKWKPVKQASWAKTVECESKYCHKKTIFTKLKLTWIVTHQNFSI